MHSFRNFLFAALSLCVLTMATAQVALTPEQWQQDLRFLQRTVHETYPFLFKKITAEAFDASVEELHAAIPDMEPHEILAGLARTVAQFEYGHTVLGYWEQKIPYHQLPIVLYHFDDGIYLQGVHREYEELAGARLTAIAGMPVEEVLERMRPVVPAENDMFVKAYGIHYLTFPEFLHAQGVLKTLEMDIPLSLEKDGRVFKAVVQAVPSQRFPTQYGMLVPGEDWVESRDTSKTPLYLKNLDRIYYYEYLPEAKTVYVRQSQVMDEEDQNIPQFYQEVFDFVEANPVEKLILDVRLNGGGNNYKNKPVVTGLVRSKVNVPGKLMVIIGRRTFSACQNLVNELHTYTNAVFVGEPTAENINFYGDNRPVTLPNSGMNAYLSFAWWQDKPQWENADWLAPQLATGMTFEQYRTNQDPALEAALAFSDSTFVTDPMAHLTALFTDGQMEKVKSEAARMIADPNYAFYDFKAELNKAAINLFNAKMLDESLYVSTMLSSFYPEAPEVWLTQGRILHAKGEVQQANEYLKKALELGAEGEVKAQAEALLTGE